MGKRVQMKSWAMPSITASNLSRSMKCISSEIELGGPRLCSSEPRPSAFREPMPTSCHRCVGKSGDGLDVGGAEAGHLGASEVVAVGAVLIGVQVASLRGVECGGPEACLGNEAIKRSSYNHAAKANCIA
jgi:hypothetical protein